MSSSSIARAAASPPTDRPMMRLRDASAHTAPSPPPPRPPAGRWKTWNFCVCDTKWGCLSERNVSGSKAEQEWHGFKPWHFQGEQRVHLLRLIQRFHSNTTPAGLADLYERGEHLLTRSRRFPRLVHQSWIEHRLPAHLSGWARSWRSLRPSWQYRLWNDTENRQLIATHYPWFLPSYDEYNHPIKVRSHTRAQSLKGRPLRTQPPRRVHTPPREHPCAPP